LRIQEYDIANDSRLNLTSNEIANLLFDDETMEMIINRKRETRNDIMKKYNLELKGKNGFEKFKSEWLFSLKERNFKDKESIG
jgi:hypothetical protein